MTEEQEMKAHHAHDLLVEALKASRRGYSYLAHLNETRAIEAFKEVIYQLEGARVMHKSLADEKQREGMDDC
jgi:hypothetical protein